MASSNSEIMKPSEDATAWCFTASKGETKFIYAWTIDDFGQKMELYKNGEFLDSDPFFVEMEGVDTSWVLRCYPRGSKDNQDDDTLGNAFVSLALLPVNSAAKNNRSINISIKLRTKEFLRIMTEEYFCFTDYEGVGWPQFAAHSDLRWDNADKMLPQDRLNIVCSMTFLGLEVNTSGTSRPTSTLDLEMGKKRQQEGVSMKMLGDLFKSGYQADVEVVCGWRTFLCHKAILGSRSPVFMAAFEHNMQERATGKITIESFDPEVVSDMLVYIYGGKIEGLEEKADKLLAVADHYDLKHLKEECEELLAKSLNVNNCLDCLLLADLHSAVLLKEMVTKFIVENLNEVVTQESWMEKVTTFPKVFSEFFKKCGSNPSK